MDIDVPNDRLPPEILAAGNERWDCRGLLNGRKAPDSGGPEISLRTRRNPERIGREAHYTSFGRSDIASRCPRTCRRPPNRSRPSDTARIGLRAPRALRFFICGLKFAQTLEIIKMKFDRMLAYEASERIAQNGRSSPRGGGELRAFCPSVIACCTFRPIPARSTHRRLAPSC